METRLQSKMENNVDDIHQELKQENQKIMMMLLNFMDETRRRMHNIERHWEIKCQSTPVDVTPTPTSSHQSTIHTEDMDSNDIQTVITEEKQKDVTQQNIDDELETDALDNESCTVYTNQTEIADNEKCRVDTDQKEVCYVENIVKNVHEHQQSQMVDLIEINHREDQEVAYKRLKQEAQYDKKKRINHKRSKRAAQHRKKKRKNRSYQFRQEEQIKLKQPRPSNTTKRKFKKFFPIFQGLDALKKQCGEKIFLLEDKQRLKDVYKIRKMKPYIPPDPGKFRK